MTSAGAGAEGIAGYERISIARVQSNESLAVNGMDWGSHSAGRRADATLLRTRMSLTARRAISSNYLNYVDEEVPLSGNPFNTV